MLSVVVVYNNQKTVNTLLLRSIAKQTAKFELTSIDTTKGQFKSASEALNYGYTGGNNIGIKYAISTSSPDYFLALNNNVVIAPDFLTSITETANNDHSIGIIVPKLYYLVYRV